MKEIQLTKGKVAMVDGVDFERLSQGVWCAKKAPRTWYAYGSGLNWGLRMHRFILGVDSPNVFVDHIDGNGLNNQRSNLRLADNAQNQQNRKSNRSNTTGFKGVCWDKRRSKFRARIKANDKQFRIGHFVNAIDAAKAYNAAAKEYFGEFARLNEIPEPDLALAA